jgi:hypothetical protein
MGRKTAQRVLLELKERVAASDMLGAEGTLDAPDVRAEAIAALVTLVTTGSPPGRRLPPWSRRTVWRRSSPPRSASLRNRLFGKNSDINLCSRFAQ